MPKVNMAAEFEQLTEQSITFEGKEGRNYTIPHPLLWPDGRYAEIDTAMKEGRFRDAAVALLGEDEFAAFENDGGTATFLLYALRKVGGIDLPN